MNKYFVFLTIPILIIGILIYFLNSRDNRYKEIYGYESWGKVILGRYLKKSGFIKLNYEGAKRLISFNDIHVTLNIESISGTTIFKPAIDKISEKLVCGDQVLVINSNGDFYAVGEMVVNAKTALGMRRGAIVKIYKKNK